MGDLILPEKDPEMLPIRPLIALGLFAIALPAAAGEIGFVEDFALSVDRARSLEQLIPGTEDYYYFHSLHYLATEQFGKVVELQAPWLQRHGETQRLWEIRTRHALLTYNKNPQAALDYLIRRAGVSFHHQREDLSAEPRLPVRLDPELIGRAQFIQRAQLVTRDNLEGFEDSAFDWLLDAELNPAERRHLLARLTRPDHPRVVSLVIADLGHEGSAGFGSLGIHRQLLLSQLEELVKKKPELLNQQAMVEAFLGKLQPGADEDWRHDTRLLQAYLDRLTAFARRLTPAHNSLKAHVLYHQLVLDRQLGKYDRERFLTYLKLPRPVGYAARRFLESDAIKRYPCDLNQNYGGLTLLAPIGNDEPLVRSYLLHFLRDLANASDFEPYINDVYLKYLLAEAKIVSGLGNAEQWASLLPPELYQQLKDRVDLEFDPANPLQFAVDQPVALDVAIKNVQTLVVKVFEINTGSWYREHLQELATDINLDGLVAGSEQTFTYNDPPARRTNRRFEFPQLVKPGVYVIDFIGSGRSSRVVIRKGRLSHVVRTTPAGQMFLVFDERRQPVKDASIWLAGREYTAGEQGMILVPFSTSPGRQPIVISRGDFSCLDVFQHEGENYALTAGIFVDRESLLTRQSAQVLIRPGLTLNGTPVSVSRIDQPRLLITSTDLDGVSTTQEIPNVPLFEDRETVHEFQVPARTASFHFSLSGKVKQISAGGLPLDVATSTAFTLNEIERTDKTEDLLLVKGAAGYVLELRGKTGEPKGGRAVQLTLKHRDFRQPVSVSLKTNPLGRVELGQLSGITQVSATGLQGTIHTWPVRQDQFTWGQLLHGREGEPLVVPIMMPSGIELSPEVASLLELRGDLFTTDRYQNLKVRDGLLILEGLPAGDYDLALKRAGVRMRVRITAGPQDHTYVLGRSRILETRPLAPLQISSLEVSPESVTVKLVNATKFTRVHVFADRFIPEYSAFDNLAAVRGVEPFLFAPGSVESVYVSGRNIGDEYSYVFNRRRAPKLPGNMLERPSLLLNPWAVRDTQTGEQQARGGEDFLRRQMVAESAADRPMAMPASSPPVPAGSFPNFDFLAHGSAVLVNLSVEDDGTLTIPLERLTGHQHVHVVAVDPLSTSSRSLALPEQDFLVLDQRLTNGLPADQHFTQQKRISVVAAGQQFELADIATSRFDIYDSLERVFSLFTTLSHDPQLVEFSPLLKWPSMSPEEKRAFYSKYASHELTLFLSRKDPGFFQEVIRPYLANKRDRTFLDHWLLEEDLAGYLEPWKFGQLNIVERILLARRIADDRPATARHVDELFRLLPPNPDRFILLFDTAVKGSALSPQDALAAIVASTESAGVPPNAGNELLRSRMMGGMGGMGGGMGGGARFGMTAGGSGMGGPGAASSPPQGLEPTDEAEFKQYDEAKSGVRGRAGIRSKRGEALQKLAIRESKEQAELSDSESDEPVELYFDTQLGDLDSLRSLYRQPDPTKEWAENNYHHLTIDQQHSGLITVNAFWRDLALHDPAQPFQSKNIAEASRSFAEMLLALALLDLPFESPKHETKFDGLHMTLTAGGPLVVYHEEIQPVQAADGPVRILVGQTYFKHGERHIQVDGEQVDRYVTDEFVIHTVYGCQVVVTNPTSSRQKLNVLLQIPQGAIPVLNTQRTRTLYVTLEPYHTQTLDYNFYFPAAGQFPHFPVQVARGEELIAFAAPKTLNVVDKPTQIDTGSWDYISQFGTPAQVLEFLGKNNIAALNLDRMAWRMQDAGFFRQAVELLAARHVYNHTLWSYALKHNVPGAAAEFLQHADLIVNDCGGRLKSRLLTIDPVARRTYEHLEYKPLVNARAHALGKRRQIVNDRFHHQYHRWLSQVARDRELTSDDLLTATYYLLLQDRVEEAREMFARVKPGEIDSKIQYDYCTAYLDFFNDHAAQARGIALKYVDHAVDRWRQTFAAIIAQLDEAEGGAAQVIDPLDRSQQQGQLAATEPSFEFQVEARQIELAYQNLDSVRINYYLMDVELLFSRNPFVQRFRGQFSAIRPNHSEVITLRGADDADAKPGSGTKQIVIPETLRNRNVMIEIVAGGQTRTQAYYSNSLTVQVIENYGQVRVTHATTGKPVSKAYVKVYAQTAGGEVKFYKDGYTDLRGRFDYASLSTSDLDAAAKFSMLILSDENGAVVREATPPKR